MTPTISTAITAILVMIVAMSVIHVVVSTFYRVKSRHLVNFLKEAAALYERDAIASTNKVERAHLLGLANGYRMASITANARLMGGPSIAQHVNGLHELVWVGNEPCACHVGVDEQQGLTILRMTHAISANPCKCVHCRRKQIEHGPISPTSKTTES